MAIASKCQNITLSYMFQYQIMPFPVCVCSVAQLCLTFWDTMDYIAHQAPLSMTFSRQEYWSGVPFPTPGNFSDSGIKPMSLVSPALAGRFLPSSRY